MKPNKWCRLGFAVAEICLLTISCQVAAHEEQRHDVTIRTSTPPAALIVEDSLHRRSGMDTAKGVPPNGNSRNYLKEIPFTDVDSQHLANDEIEEGPTEPSTAWFVSIMDGGDQSYTANLIGVAEGIADLEVEAGKPAQGMIKPFDTPVLVRAGVTRQVRVIFTPTQGFTLRVERVVSATDLIDSVAIACDLRLIGPSGMCRSLRAKAEAAAAAAKRNNLQAAHGQWKAFLRELTAQGNKHIKDPALTVLREEVQILLGQAVRPTHKP